MKKIKWDVDWDKDVVGWLTDPKNSSKVQDWLYNQFAILFDKKPTQPTSVNQKKPNPSKP